MHNKKHVFYLKINRVEGYTIRNMKHWLEIVHEYDDMDYYVICDNEALKNKVINELKVFFPDVEGAFFESIISEETADIVTKVTDERWKMAGYAHISTFAHAREKGYDTFWNIDADDTRFCLSPARSRQLLDQVEKHANDNGIDCFSLDMHVSRISSGRHWSFGVTYVTNRDDWFDIMRKASLCDISKEDQWPNIDRFFRFIRNNKFGVRIESFYFENLKFLHYSNDFFWRLNISALYHWKDGRLIFPILYYGVGLKNEKANKRIDSIVHKLDINISDEETTISMLRACNSPSYFLSE